MTPDAQVKCKFTQGKVLNCWHGTCVGVEANFKTVGKGTNKGSESKRLCHPRR